MADLRDQLQASLGTSYTVKSELGGGGMSRVFVADETALSRRVVVKVLPPELSASVNVDRFRREILVAARLQHACIVPVLSAGVADGLPYYTMPLVEGESLRQRLTRSGKLPLNEAVRLLRDLAEALSHAHEQGIVHRDIKPDNVLLTKHHALISDFGVAKALSASTTLGDSATQAGVALGTPAYMAPEQALGEPNVDARADMYALGVTAYEMLTGQTPFPGSTAHAVLASKLSNHQIIPLSQLRPDLPPALAEVLSRCLAANPDERPQSAEELIAVLDSISGAGEARVGVAQTTSKSRLWVAGAALVVVALGAGALLVRRAPVSHPPRLIVLPCENLGPAADAYFATGLTAEITGRLSGVGALEVIGQTTAQGYDKNTASPSQLARDLGITHLLACTVRWDHGGTTASRVRVNTQLVRASDRTQLWAGPYEGPLTDVFAFQERVADSVAAALNVVLADRSKRAAVRSTSNMEAYNAYLRGIANSTRPKVYDYEGRRAAVADFLRASTLDTSFAPAHARLAMAYLRRAEMDGDTASLRLAEGSLRRALALDSTSLESRLALTRYEISTGNPEEALRLATAAIAREPSSVDLLVELGLAQWSLRKDDEAIATMERAHTLDPRSPDPSAWLAGLNDDVGRHEAAIEWRERELALTPDNAAAYHANAMSYILWRGDTASARKQLVRGIAAVGVARMGFAEGRYWGSGSLAPIIEPPELIRFLDTVSLRTMSTTPAAFYYQKATHFSQNRRAEAARAYADSGIRDSLTAGDHLRLARLYAIAGNVDAESREAALAASATDRQQDRRFIALNYTHIAASNLTAGRRDAAIDALKVAIDAHAGFFLSPELLRIDPLWDPLRSDARFQRLMAGRN